jgi:site-specific recombinase XerD
MDELIVLFSKYLQLEKNASEHTLEAYMTDLSQFVAFVEPRLDGEMNWNSIDRFMVRAWVMNLSDQALSKKTIARKIASLRSFFKYVVKRGYVDKNPTSHLPSIKLDQRLPEWVSEQEMIQLLEEASPSDASSMKATSLNASKVDPLFCLEQAVLELFYSSGIRVSEMVNLRYNDVDFRSGLIKVTGKGRKQRIIPIGEQAKKHLLTWLSLRQSIQKTQQTSANEQLFLTKRGKPATREFLYRIVKKRLQQTEIKQKSPHTIRHSFATHLLDHGADIRVVKELLGHSSLAATQIYTHTSKEQLRKSYQSAHPRAGKASDAET